jgi:hypothetical protein
METLAFKLAGLFLVLGPLMAYRLAA